MLCYFMHSSSLITKCTNCKEFACNLCSWVVCCIYCSPLCWYSLSYCMFLHIIMHVTGPGETDVIKISVILSNTSYRLIGASHELCSSWISCMHFTKPEISHLEKQTWPSIAVLSVWKGRSWVYIDVLSINELGLKSVLLQ